MAYCKRCGAYIPDGQTECLACGYDEAAEKKAAEEKKKRKENCGGFAAQEYEAEKRELERRRRAKEQAQRESERQERIRDYDERRRQQQENNKKWAESEAQRRRERDDSERGYDNTAGRNFDKPLRHKAMAVLSYLSFFFVLPFIFCRDDKFAMYHAKQGIALAVFSLIVDVLSASLGIVGGLLNFARLYLMVKGMLNASNDKMDPLPYIGKYAER